MAESLIALQPGTIIAGRYEVIKCLGTGSMGVVYACRHRELAGHMVAIKVLFPEVAQDETASARFRNEIFASYGVSHPNVVRAYEYIRDGDIIAYTMEYVEGGDLADRLNLKKAIPIDEVVDILAQMCAGVQAIHDAGIVHRDLKPENILVRKDGVVKIADFGIARTGHGPKLTEHGGVVGTIDYVSPEYILESHVDWRSDIYAIGILGYEMLTGQSPFRADSVYATMTMRLKTDPKAPSLLRHDCARELDQIVLKAMARAPEQRYQSANEILNDINRMSPNRKLRISTAIQVKSVDPQLNYKEERAPKINYPEDRIPKSRVSSEGAYFGAAKHSSSGTEIINRSSIFSTDVSAGPSIMMGSGNDSTLIDDPEIFKQDLTAPKQQMPYDFDEDPRMAPMLSRGAILNKTVGSRSLSVAVVPKQSQPSNNRGRLQQLHESSARRKQSYWIEIISVLLAMVVGIAAGLYFMQEYIFNEAPIKTFESQDPKLKELEVKAG